MTMMNKVQISVAGVLASRACEHFHAAMCEAESKSSRKTWKNGRVSLANSMFPSDRCVFSSSPEKIKRFFNIEIGHISENNRNVPCLYLWASISSQTNKITDLNFCATHSGMELEYENVSRSLDTGRFSIVLHIRDATSKNYPILLIPMTTTTVRDDNVPYGELSRVFCGYFGVMFADMDITATENIHQYFSLSPLFLNPNMNDFFEL